MSNKDFNPVKPQNIHDFRSFCDWWAAAWREGNQIERLPCEEYCRQRTDEKTAEVFAQCLKFCQDHKDFAEWHRKN